MNSASEMRTKRWVILIILMGFALVLSAARGHLVSSLVNESPGGTAETCLDRLRAGPEAGADVPGVGAAATAEPPAQVQVCVF